MARTARPTPVPSPPPPPTTAEPSETLPVPETPILLETSGDGSMGWDGEIWRPMSDFDTSTDVEPDGVVSVSPDSIPPNEPAPARRRGRPRKEDSPADPDAPFSPRVTSLHANAKRIVRTGQYESFEVMAHIEALPDPRFNTTTNLSMLCAAVTQEVNDVAERIAREAQIGK